MKSASIHMIKNKIIRKQILFLLKNIIEKKNLTTVLILIPVYKRQSRRKGETHYLLYCIDIKKYVHTWYTYEVLAV